MPDDAYEQLRQLAIGFDKAAGMAMQTFDSYSHEVATDIASIAMRDCPVKTAHLVSTCEIRQERTGTGRYASGYTVGFYADYALAVEERSELHHENGKAHYLRDAVYEVESQMADRADAALEDIAKKAGLR